MDEQQPNCEPKRGAAAFFIPPFGGMICIMNGMGTRLELRAGNEGDYQGLSSRFSGGGFPNMLCDVPVISPLAFPDSMAKTARGGAGHHLFHGVAASFLHHGRRPRRQRHLRHRQHDHRGADDRREYLSLAVHDVWRAGSGAHRDGGDRQRQAAFWRER